MRKPFLALVLALLSLAPVLSNRINAEEADEAEDSDGVTRVRIVNGLEDRVICLVFISLVTDDEWGPNRLPENEEIRPEKAAEWVIEPGGYDLRVQDDRGDTYTLNNVEVGEGQTAEWTVIPDDPDTGDAGKGPGSGESDGEDEAGDEF